MCVDVKCARDGMMLVMNVSLQMASRFIMYPSAPEPPRGLPEAPPQKSLR